MTGMQLQALARRHWRKKTPLEAADGTVTSHNSAHQIISIQAPQWRARRVLQSCRRISSLSDSTRSRPGPVWQPTGDPHRPRKHRDHDSAAVGNMQAGMQQDMQTDLQVVGGRKCGQVYSLQEGRRRDRRLVLFQHPIGACRDAFGVPLALDVVSFS